MHGKFLSAQSNGTLEWNRDTIGAWEEFELIDASRHGGGGGGRGGGRGRGGPRGGAVASAPPAPIASAPPAPPVAVATAAPATQLMAVTVPAGIVSGMPFIIMSPSGQQMQVVCPAGAGAGQQIHIQVPI